MMQLYRIVANLIYWTAFKFFWFRSTTDELWAGRLATKLPAKADIWMHAASVGEVRIISHLLDYLRGVDPSLTYHITVMTRTGYQTAKSACGDFAQVSYFPLDVPMLWRKFLDRMQPRIVVIAETEIWPNLIETLESRKIPVVLVNGRLSEKAHGRYTFVRGEIGRLLSTYDHLFLKGSEDQKRYKDLGVPDTKMTMAGDMKFDAPLVERTADQKNEMRRFLSVSPEQFLLVAGSTRPGEEAQLVALYQNLKDRFPGLRIALVPRHIERTNEIMTSIQQLGSTAQIAGTPISPDDRSLRLVDKMGMLIDLFACADLAFVGGTLVELGGHNLLEPVWAGTPVLFGPSVYNVHDAADYITSHNFGMKVATIDEMELAVVDILNGKRTFGRKTRTDLSRSATALAGNHILKRLAHA
jgi:3-deoxy-D-manno-octulosonic-acid transferase